MCKPLKDQPERYVSSPCDGLVSTVVACNAGVQCVILLSDSDFAKLEFSSQLDGSATPFSPPIRQAYRWSQGTNQPSAPKYRP